MFLIDVKPSKAKGKKLAAVFCPCKTKSECKGCRYKIINFGQDGSTTYINGATDQTKAAYLARHKVTENWNDPTTAGALSRWLLWNKRSLSASILDFKKRFNL